MPTNIPTSHRDSAAKLALLDRWRGRPPGQSRTVFCRQQRIKPWTLAYLLRPCRSQLRPGFVEIVPAATVSTLDISIGRARIHLGRDFDPALRRTVVEALSGCDGAPC